MSGDSHSAKQERRRRRLIEAAVALVCIGAVAGVAAINVRAGAFAGFLLTLAAFVRAFFGSVR